MSNSEYGRGPMMRLLDKSVEPVKRNKDGLRWIDHRFPIRGGISLMEAAHRDTLEAIRFLHRRQAEKAK